MATYVTDVLTATAATTTGSPTPTRTWQWLRGSTTISGATTNSYTVTAEDLGQPVTARQTETNFLGTTSATGVADGSVLALDPIRLFSASEPGIYYDPSDITTLYTDNIGTTPVAAPGQTVGLMLDKSKGLVLGPELVTNSTFVDGTTTGWTITGGSLGTITVVSGELEMKTGGAGILVSTPISLVVGKSYALSGAGRLGTYSTAVEFGVASTNSATPTQQTFISTTQSVKTAIFTATATTMYVILRFPTVGTAGQTAYFDNISVRELPGNHATQATLGQRPIYGVVPKGGRRNLLTWSEDFTNADWTKGASLSEGSSAASKIITATSANAAIYRFVTVSPSAVVCTNSIEIRRITGTGAIQLKLPGNGGNPITVTNDWTRFSASGAAGGTINYYVLEIATAGDAIEIRFPQLELGSTATPYQRVSTTFDVTEAGVTSVGYLAFDTDKWMVTNTITPGTDKAQVFVGVNKFGTASYPVLVELGTGTTGGFVWHGNGLNSSTAYFANYSSTNAVAFFSDGGINQPYVGSLLLDRAGTSGALSEIIFRKNSVTISGTQDGANPDSTGNYLAYPLYIGRRSGSSLPFNGHLYPLIVRFGPNLSAARIAAMESWVSTKTPGVTL